MENITELQKKVLIYLSNKDDYVSLMELALTFGISRPTLVNIMSTFQEEKLVDARLTGRGFDLKINDDGKKLVQNLERQGDVDVDKVAKELQFVNLEEFIGLKDEITVMENNVRDIEAQLETKLNQTKNKMDELDKKLYDT